jgi:hypothetical protein
LDIYDDIANGLIYGSSGAKWKFTGDFRVLSEKDGADMMWITKAFLKIVGVDPDDYTELKCECKKECGDYYMWEEDSSKTIMTKDITEKFVGYMLGRYAVYMMTPPSTQESTPDEGSVGEVLTTIAQDEIKHIASKSQLAKDIAEALSPKSSFAQAVADKLKQFNEDCKKHCESKK